MYHSFWIPFPVPLLQFVVAAILFSNALSQPLNTQSGTDKSTRN